MKKLMYELGYINFDNSPSLLVVAKLNYKKSLF